MWAILAATSVNFLSIVQDPASVRYCVVAAEAKQASEIASNGEDDFMAAIAGEVAKAWRARAMELGAGDPAALQNARDELADTGPGGIGYRACEDLLMSAPADGSLVDAARDLDRAGAPVPMGGPVPREIIPLEAMNIPHVQAVEPDIVIVPGQNNILACYALLTNLAAGLPADSGDRKIFAQGAARLADGWSINLYASRAANRTYLDDLDDAAAGFDVAAFEALSEAEGEARMSYCFGKAGIE